MSEIDVRDSQCENCRKFSHCNNNDLVCITKFQQLKADNEELKEKLKNNTKFWKNKCLDKVSQSEKLLDTFYVVETQKIKYKQCLDEIEGIANDDSFPSDFDVYEERDFYFNQLCKIDNILQKIKQAKEE